jgi:hypothetical protein
MNVFRLKFTDDGFGVAKDVEFRAPDAGRALAIAQGETRGRAAELWRDGEMVCTLRRNHGRGDFWEINPNG